VGAICRLFDILRALFGEAEQTDISGHKNPLVKDFIMHTARMRSRGNMIHN
jgi:hypothetical protein